MVMCMYRLAEGDGGEVDVFLLLSVVLVVVIVVVGACCEDCTHGEFVEVICCDGLGRLHLSLIVVLIVLLLLSIMWCDVVGVVVMLCDVVSLCA